MRPLASAIKKTDGVCAGNKCADSEECVGVVRAVTGRGKRSYVIDIT